MNGAGAHGGQVPAEQELRRVLRADGVCQRHPLPPPHPLRVRLRHGPRLHVHDGAAEGIPDAGGGRAGGGGGRAHGALRAQPGEHDETILPEPPLTPLVFFTIRRVLRLSGV
eukprot:1108703-Prorocentrum_minimum.AAC.1